MTLNVKLIWRAKRARHIVYLILKSLLCSNLEFVSRGLFRF